MRLHAIGVGGAGGRIVDELLRRDGAAPLPGGVVAGAGAVDTDLDALAALDRVPGDRRLPLGGDRTAGRGVGGDANRAAAVATDAADRLPDALGEPGADALALVAALGGGTGAGATPALARRLRTVRDRPVYAVALLPGETESRLRRHTAARSLRALRAACDGLLLFDDDAGGGGAGESAGTARARTNRTVARRLVALCGAGETTDPSPASVVDAADLAATLDGGAAVVGRASAETAADDGLAARLVGGGPVDEGTAADRIETVVRRATLDRLSVTREPAAADRALVVVAGPPAHLSRAGLGRTRKWLADATGAVAVRAGDRPVPDGDRVAATVLLGGVGAPDRFDPTAGADADAADGPDATDAVVGEAGDRLDDLV
jgi:cell division GTPase FtsZ